MKRDPGFWMKVAAATHIPPEQIELELHGEIDLNIASQFWDLSLEVSTGQVVTVSELFDRYKEVYLNLRHLDFIDGTGIQLILDLTNRKARGRCFISALPDKSAPNRVFRLTRTLPLLPIRECREA